MTRNCPRALADMDFSTVAPSCSAILTLRERLSLSHNDDATLGDDAVSIWVRRRRHSDRDRHRREVLHGGCGSAGEELTILERFHARNRGLVYRERAGGGDVERWIG